MNKTLKQHNNFNEISILLNKIITKSPIISPFKATARFILEHLNHKKFKLS